MCRTDTIGRECFVSKYLSNSVEGAPFLYKRQHCSAPPQALCSSLFLHPCRAAAVVSEVWALSVERWNRSCRRQHFQQTPSIKQQKETIWGQTQARHFWQHTYRWMTCCAIFITQIPGIDTDRKCFGWNNLSSSSNCYNLLSPKHFYLARMSCL